MGKLELSDKFVKILLDLPESGMGYQIVDVKLNNGTTLTGRKVFNSTYMELFEHEKISSEDIKEVKLNRKL